ncbi:hypothetical protein SAMN04488057_107128 [Cyclobacterium lianum]|uniref:Uncharacterized protein n=1 Tax=Cyclobacterium lianum TaxID=388280 RepID=A0A1M7P856_9BACT|nr:hypothetical protein [Cyclobacterium lianum]SHN12917.1 hypothetical protein SAMN04488057_107128 [Cyclobacterium lianum]
MDSGTIFYLIAIIIYFIYTTFARKKEPEMDNEAEVPEQAPKRGPSFEELLREIRNEQSERERDLQQDEPEVLAEETPEVSGRTSPGPSEERPVKTEETSYRDPYRNIKQPLVKLDDQVDLEDDRKILGEVVDVAEEYSGRSKYARMLKNSESARDAVILTEIFNRRHF